MGIPYAEVIGDPISHSKSPRIHRFWLRKMGMAGDYRAVRVREGELAGYFGTRRNDPDWRGCNVTMPHKRGVPNYVDRLSSEAQRIGAVNTIARSGGDLVGLNTDWIGIDRALPTGAATDKDVLLIGAGGAARAAMQVLSMAGPRSISVRNRDVGKARRLLADFAMRGRADSVDAPLTPCDLLLNASALGMAGFPPLALDLAPLRNQAVVMDMVYDPRETVLLRDARNRGLAAIDGLSMLIHQAAAAFRHFFGEEVAEPDSAELRELLTS
jgi:shikimate dehydrogenase